MICRRCGRRLKQGLSASENPRFVHADSGLERCHWEDDGFKAAHEQIKDAENQIPKAD